MLGNHDTTTPPVATAERERNDFGQFVTGNREGLRHGLHAKLLAPALAAEREAFLLESLIDDGGESELSARRRSLHEYRARLHTHITQLSDALEQLGLFDSRGRLRTAWLQQLANYIDKARALDVALGLDRRQKNVPTLVEVMRGDE